MQQRVDETVQEVATSHPVGEFDVRYFGGICYRVTKENGDDNSANT